MVPAKYNKVKNSFLSSSNNSSFPVLGPSKELSRKRYKQQNSFQVVCIGALEIYTFLLLCLYEPVPLLLRLLNCPQGVGLRGLKLIPEYLCQEFVCTWNRHFVLIPPGSCRKYKQRDVFLLKLQAGQLFLQGIGERLLLDLLNNS